MAKVIGIVGSRRRNEPTDFVLVNDAFWKIFVVWDSICSGGCPTGADKFAERIAFKNSIAIEILYADWKRYGRGADFIRNSTIVDRCDVIIACVADDRKGGTEDTIKKFLKKLAMTESEAIEKGRLILV